jgi:hypothetical protein
MKNLNQQIGELEGWHVDDPLSPFVGEEVISRAEVMEILRAHADVNAKLLAALKVIVAYTLPASRFYEGTPEFEMARAAIAKAEGR